MRDAYEADNSIRAIKIYKVTTSWTIAELNEIINLYTGSRDFLGLVSTIISDFPDLISERVRNRCVSKAIQMADATLLKTAFDVFPETIEGMNIKRIANILRDTNLTIAAIEYPVFRRRVIDNLGALVRDRSWTWPREIARVLIRENYPLEKYVSTIAQQLLRIKSPVIYQFIQLHADPIGIIDELTFKHVNMCSMDQIENFYFQLQTEEERNAVGSALEQHYWYGDNRDNIFRRMKLYCKRIPDLVPRMRYCADQYAEYIIYAHDIDQTQKKRILFNLARTGYKPVEHDLQLVMKSYSKFYYEIVRILFLKGIIRHYLMIRGRIPFKLDI